MCVTEKLGIKHCKCGGKAEYITSKFAQSVIVYCLKCNQKVAATSLKEAVEMWNASCE